jgi:hypothetical protein
MSKATSENKSDYTSPWSRIHIPHNETHHPLDGIETFLPQRPGLYSLSQIIFILL